jgi:hypothetical protein
MMIEASSDGYKEHFINLNVDLGNAPLLTKRNSKFLALTSKFDAQNL